MYNHEPENYKCPLCLLARGIESDEVYSKQADIIYKDENVTAFISSHWWPNNKGHVIIIPNKHFENIYDLPDDLSCKIHKLEKEVSLALKQTYNCDGVSSRQHNEPAGNQDVWHYHLHIFPRYDNDNLYINHLQKRKTEPEERFPYAEKLRNYFKGF